MQLTSAVTLLERLGLVHGDLQPANILLDANNNIQVGGFDATARPGAELMVASEPFCKIFKNLETPPAGPVSEQFSLASCIYTIWLAHPASAGCDVTDDFASTSKTSPIGVLAKNVVKVVLLLLGARKMEDGVVRVGRRVGRLEKVLMRR